MKKIVITSLFLLSLTASSFATCILIILVPGSGRIYLAADSKVTSGDKKTLVESKIFESGKWYFSCFGLVEDINTGYSPKQTVAKYLYKMQNYDTVVIKKIRDTLGKMLKKQIRTLKMIKNFKIDTSLNYMFGFCLIGLNKGIPFAYISTISIDFKKENLMPEEAYIDLLSIKRNKTYPLGAKDEIVAFLGNPKRMVWNLNDTNTAEQYINFLMDISISANSNFVGRPIDIITLDKSGFAWQKEYNKHRVFDGHNFR